MFLSDLSIKRPVFATVMMLALVTHSLERMLLSGQVAKVMP